MFEQAIFLAYQYSLASDDPTPQSVDHAAHVGGPTTCAQRIVTTNPLSALLLL